LLATLFGMYPSCKRCSLTPAIRDRNSTTRCERSCLTSKRRSSSVQIRSDLRCCPSAGSSSVPSPGSTVAEGSPKIGRTSIAKRSHSCASPQSASCSENSAIPSDLSGQTLSLTESESRGQRRGESSIWQDSRFSDGEAEMDLPRSNDGNARFLAYVEGLTSVIGHTDRAKPLRDYCLGLMMPCERKSVEPMAAITAPERTAAQHQSLLHFVGEGKWSDGKVLAKVRELVLPKMERHGQIEAWIIDDTGFPKKGQHSVGVARQYCGELGKQDNCQVAVTLSIANHDASLPVAYQLYLPKDWASDRKRRRKVGVPDEVTFKTKPEIALAQIRWACEAGLPRGAVLMDAGYGVDTDLRTSITALGLSYVAGIQSHTTVWAPGTDPRRPKQW